MKTFESKHVAVSIRCPIQEVYGFLANPANLPQWAAGLSSTIANAGDEWIAEAPVGKLRIRFADKNPYGVLDHYVTLESGVSMYIPMRVVRNGEGSEILFTLFRLPNTTDEQFAADSDAVEQDLRRVKAMLERSAAAEKIA